MSTFPSEEWFEAAVDWLANDAQFDRTSVHFDATVLFEFGDDGYVVELSDGEIDAVHTEPMFVGWDFAVRAPVDTWENLLSESPPPFYNDLRSVWLQYDLEIEGDLKRAIQHWRPLKRMVTAFAEVSR
ncbi:hypothetical protein ACFQMM_22975 [Saliphagus sp. GCM10025308]